MLIKGKTDPLSSLLARYLPLEDRPVRDLIGDYHGRNVEKLVHDGSWRALARYARDTLVSRETTDIRTILEVSMLSVSRRGVADVTSCSSGISDFTLCFDFSLMHSIHAN